MTKRLPSTTAWKPGRSGNPAGRDKGAVNEIAAVTNRGVPIDYIGDEPDLCNARTQAGG